MKKDKIILRVDTEFKKDVENKAKEKGLSISSFIRMILTERLKE